MPSEIEAAGFNCFFMECNINFILTFFNIYEMSCNFVLHQQRGALVRRASAMKVACMRVTPHSTDKVKVCDQIYPI